MQATLPPPRFASLNGMAVAAPVYLAGFGGAVWAWLNAVGAAPGAGASALCAGPALLATALALRSQADRHAYTINLLAPLLMLPILLLMWASSEVPTGEPQPWLALGGFALAHALAFVGGIVWLARSTTRVEPGAGTPRVDAELLQRRLASLQRAGLPIDIDGAAGTWTVRWRYPADVPRSHVVHLDVDAAAGVVQVRERRSAAGARPETDGEADMRSAGDSAFDPSRPSADRVWFNEAVATQVLPAQLAAVPLALGDGAAWPGPAAASNPTAMVTLLCALVTRSGFVWQPVLFTRRPERT